MFELPGLPVLRDLPDAALIDLLEHRTRTEAMVAAQRLATIAEVVARHCDDEDDISAHQVIDGWECAAAAISAACRLTRGAASTQMRIAQALSERLPKVAAVFERGEISAKVVAKITWRTQLIIDEDALALIDTALAGAAFTYGALSETKAEQAIDVWVEKFDPAAVRKTRTAARDRDIHFGSPDDPSGVVTMWGRLSVTDAALLKKLLNTMARGVCDNDPRTMGQRRSDSLGAIGAGADHLTCQCANPDCDATGVDPRSRAVVIHLLAQTLPTTATDSGDSGNDGYDDGSGGGGGDAGGDADPANEDTEPADEDNPHTHDAPADDEQTPTEIQPAAQTSTDDVEAPLADTDVTEPAPVESPTAAHLSAPRDPRIHGEPHDYTADRTPAVCGGPAVILGGGIVPAPLLAELIATGATIDYLSDPDDLTTQTGYRPSAKLATFVRMRDLICTFPGCGVSASYCDLDHTIPWPHGATHPGNLGPKCRNHHLLKTFHNGEDGWTDIQHPDGSHTWTAPTGHTYHTTPFSRILFPDWATHTPAPPPGPARTTPTDRAMKMPVRKRTRNQTRTQRINTERRQNTEQDKPPPYWP